MRDPKERLRDILEAIANIERYVARGRQAFEKVSLFRIGSCVIFRLSARQRKRFPKNYAISGRTSHGLRS